MRPDAGEGEKRTNEIGTVIPLLETLPDIANRTVTADALLTQRAARSPTRPPIAYDPVGGRVGERAGAE